MDRKFLTSRLVVFNCRKFGANTANLPSSALVTLSPRRSTYYNLNPNLDLNTIHMHPWRTQHTQRALQLQERELRCLMLRSIIEI